eukprot:COSAG04_NODE_8855_length_924_cov_0.707879_1_plen_35_part_10
MADCPAAPRMKGSTETLALNTTSPCEQLCPSPPPP